VTWRNGNSREPKTRAKLTGVPLVSAERASRALHRWGAKVPVLRPGTEGWVYFALRPGLRLKVGWSRDPARRIAQIEDCFCLRGEAKPVVLVGPCHRKAEYTVLDALAGFRLKSRRSIWPQDEEREMFYPTREVLELCAMLRAAAEAQFFENKLAPYASGPRKHCRFCGLAQHTAPRCTTAEAKAFYGRRAA
jgi:hypothetical protein